MSDLYRSAISARIAKLPTTLPPAGDEDEEDEAGDSLGSLPGSGMGPPAMPRVTPPATTSRNRRKTPNTDFSPLSASSYFTSAVQVAVPERKLDARVYYTPPKFADGTVMICHHGAGYSGLSFAGFAKEVVEMSLGECGVMSLDARRHGKTTSTEEDENLDIEVLVQDFLAIVKSVFPDPSSSPSLLLVGHSMGGSVVTRACPLLQSVKYRIAGVAVLDVVEGTALEALPHMHSLLNSRPDGFDSVEDAVEWHVKTKTIRNPTSARISVPSMFVEAPPSSSISSPKYIWRTPLRSTAPYWTSWFTSLSSLFLSVRTARLLVLAGTERLDKELMIGQMQGKFQLVVVPGTGHMIQEDDPTTLAEILVEFWRRNEKVTVVKGIKKVGDA